MREANPRLSEERAAHLARWGTHGIDGGYVWKFDPWIHTRSLIHNLRFEEMTDIWAQVTCPVLHVIGGASEHRRGRLKGRPVDSYFTDASRVENPGGRSLGAPRPAGRADAGRQRVPGRPHRRQVGPAARPETRNSRAG